MTRSVEGPIHTTNYAEIRKRALKVAQRLDRDGIRLGDRVATLAWNTWRHLEAWYGIIGIGAIYHTVNPRLFPEQIAWIINHAEDRVMITDLTFVPLLEKIADKLTTVERYVILTDAAHMPATTLQERRAPTRNGSPRPTAISPGRASTRTPPPACATPPAPPAIPRACSTRTAPTCCTPSWRRCRTPWASSSRDVVLPVVPMFHANGWSLAFSTPMIGATLVMPGAKLDGASIYELLDTLQGDLHRRGADRLADAAAAPREATGAKLPHLKRVVIGGSACPRAMTQTFQDKYGVEVIHAWGMTEMSPLGTLCTMKPEYAELARRGAARRPDEAGPSAVRRRDENHRRRRHGRCRGTARPSAA